MSERDTLKDTLPPDVHDDIERLYDRAPDPDPRDIVAALHKEGLLDAGQLKSAVLALETRNRIRHVAPRPPETVGAPVILGQLGAGAMGEVLIAKDPGLNRVVAVKRIHPDAARNKSMMRRFYTEAQVNAQLDHPSIVPIHGLVQDEEGGLAYAMKLVRGRTLEDYLDEASYTDDDDHGLNARLERFLHVCDAMAYAHERGIVHRDLKPENIMVGAFGEVLVMDWGIAKILSFRDDPIASEEPDKPNPNIRGTRVGQVMGTPRYMSPEQAQGRNDILDARSDQYALGMILQELVTLEGAIPDDLDLAGCLGWAQQAKRLPMAASRELTGIVDKACAKNPEDRYETVAALAEDIRRTLRDEAPLAAPDGFFGKIQRWVGKHRRTALFLMAAPVMLGVLAVGSLLGIGGAALAWQQYAAQERESQLTNVLHRAMDRANGVDRKLADIEALVAGLAGAADISMAKAAPNLPYNVLSAKPPRLHDTGKYGKMSVDFASVASNGAARKPTLERLAELGEPMSRALVSVVTRDARRQTAEDIAKKLDSTKSPVVWAHLGTLDGQFAQAPGTWAYKKDYPKPKELPWFRAATEGRGAQWTRPYLDESGMGQVVSCAVPWFDDKSRLQGVASMDISVAWLSKRIRAIGDAKVYLLDKEGNVMLSTETDGAADPKFEPLPHEDHAPSITHDKAGWHEAWDGSLAVWSPLHSTGWTWVVIASSDVLRGKAGEAIQTD